MTTAANSYDESSGGVRLRRPFSTRGQWIVRLGLFTLLWWIVTAGDGSSWIVGVPVVLMATWLSVYLAAGRPLRVSPSGLAAYLLFFAVESIRGGVDVARRVLLPASRVDPHLLHYRTALECGLPRNLLVYTVSLLPGTLAVDIEGDLLTVHALSRDMQALQSVSTCERRVAAVFRPSVGLSGSGP